LLHHISTRHGGSEWQMANSKWQIKAEGKWQIADSKSRQAVKGG
jgi:hypothetical protein